MSINIMNHKLTSWAPEGPSKFREWSVLGLTCSQL